MFPVANVLTAFLESPNMARRRFHRSQQRTFQSTRRYSGRVFNIPYAKPRGLPRSFSIDNQLVDTRRFFPHRRLPVRPTYTLGGSSSRIHTSIRKGNLYVQQRFSLPDHLAPCIRRQTRKEVIFATGHGGRKLGTKRIRRSATSEIRC